MNRGDNYEINWLKLCNGLGLFRSFDNHSSRHLVIIAAQEVELITILFADTSLMAVRINLKSFQSKYSFRGS